MTNVTATKIAPLPFPESFLLRYLIAPYYLSKYDLAFASSDYEKLTKIIIRLVNAAGADKITQRVKIKRIYGLEESSTNWSLGMTLEHLVLVGEGFMKIIQQLNDDGKSSVIANPALVKPQGEIADPLALFTDHIQKYKDFIAGINFSKNSTSTNLHPWVGELTQKDWHSFTVIHLQVHLRQIKIIFDHLKDN